MNDEKKIINKINNIKSYLEKNENYFKNNENFPGYLKYSNIINHKSIYLIVIKFFYIITDFFYKNNLFYNYWLDNIKEYLLKDNFKDYEEYYFLINNFSSIYLKLNKINESIEIINYSIELCCKLANQSIYTLQCNNLYNCYFLLNEYGKANDIIKKGYNNMDDYINISIKTNNIKEIKIYLFNLINNYRIEKILNTDIKLIQYFQNEVLRFSNQFFKDNSTIQNYIKKFFAKDKKEKNKKLFSYLKDKIKKKKINMNLSIKSKNKKIVFSPQMNSNRKKINTNIYRSIKKSKNNENTWEKSFITNTTFKKFKINLKKKFDDNINRYKKIENNIDNKAKEIKNLVIKNKDKFWKKKNKSKLKKFKIKMNNIINNENKLHKSMEYHNAHLKSIENNLKDIKNKIYRFNEEKIEISPITHNINISNFDQPFNNLIKKPSNNFSIQNKNKNDIKFLKINSLNYDSKNKVNSNENLNNNTNVNNTNNNININSNNVNNRSSFFKGNKSSHYFDSLNSISKSRKKVTIFNNYNDSTFYSYLFYENQFYNFILLFNYKDKFEINININNDNDVNLNEFINNEKVENLIKMWNSQIFIPNEIKLNLCLNYTPIILNYLKNSVVIEDSIIKVVDIPNSLISEILINLLEKYYVYWFYHLNSNYFRIILYIFNKENNKIEIENFITFDVELEVTDIVTHFDIYKKEDIINSISSFVLKSDYKNKFRQFLKLILINIFNFLKLNNKNVEVYLKNNYHLIKIYSIQSNRYSLINFNNLNIKSYNFFKTYKTKEIKEKLIIDYTINKKYFKNNFGLNYDTLINDEKEVLFLLTRKVLNFKFINTEEELKSIPSFLIKNYNQATIVNFDVYHYFKFYIKDIYTYPIITEMIGFKGYYFALKIKLYDINKSFSFIIIINQRLNELTYNLLQKKSKYKNILSNSTYDDINFIKEVGAKKLLDFFFNMNIKNNNIKINFHGSVNQKVLIIENLQNINFN